MEIIELKAILPYVLLVVICVVCALCIWPYWRHNKRKRIVQENSKYYQNILSLNAETKYHQGIGNNGIVEYVMWVKSKAQHDRTSTRSALDEYLTSYPDTVRRLLDEVDENRKIFLRYIRAFNSFAPEITLEECKNLGIDYNLFVDIEKRMVESQKLDMIQTLSLKCFVKYTSPQGRNHYSKSCMYLESEIRSALKERLEKNAFMQTEEFRRKAERSKVTPSLRYQILERDAGRCRMCGRSAKDGVELEVDHIVPVSKGGRTTHENLQTLCRECNRGKGAK